MNSEVKPLVIVTAICAVVLSTAAFGAGMRSGAPVSATHISSPTRTSAPMTTRASTPTKAATTALATGQPNQSCGSATAPNTPGNAAAAPGSAFNPDGKSGTVYAGQQPQNSNNPASVSQYDVACSKQP